MRHNSSKAHCSSSICKLHINVRSSSGSANCSILTNIAPQLARFNYVNTTIPSDFNPSRYHQQICEMHDVTMLHTIVVLQIHSLILQQVTVPTKSWVSKKGSNLPLIQAWRLQSTTISIPNFPGGGTQPWVTRHVPPKRPYFFRWLSPKDPHFYQLSLNDPLFLTNSLLPKGPDTSLSLKDPSILHLIVKQVTIFGKKLIFRKFPLIWRNVEKFFAILALKAPIFDAFHWNTPYFCALCHWKIPFFDAICHRKTPTSEVLGGTRTSLSYVSAPPRQILSRHQHQFEFQCSGNG